MKTIMFRIAVFSLLLSSCEMYNTTAQYSYQYPDSLSDGFYVGSLAEVNMSTRPIEEAVNKIYRGQYKEVHSMLIYKDGKLVLEEYFKGHDFQWDAPDHHSDLVSWDRDMPHYTHSVSKSITSMCVGIAIDKGFIENAQQSIFDYLPDYQYLKTEGKHRITIEHLLTGTSGLQWAEWNAPLSSVANDQIAIWFSEKSPVDFVLSRPLVSETGTHFVYSGGNFDVLGVILENASGLSFQDFSEKYLFEPLGMDSAYWHQVYPTGEVHAAGGLRATPREMVKLGVSMLELGSWNGQHIISEDWVEYCAKPYPGNRGINIPGEPSGKLGYSYSWWTKDYTVGGKRIHMYAAGGWGGQHIMVLPEVNMVVVFTGGNYLSKRPPFKILEKYILPAID
jgi:CubicO group peptidase (beta-lactamase class C family)